MTEDDGIRIVGLQRLQQGMQGSLLLPGAGVGIKAVRSQPTFIAHADTVLVVVPGMGTDKILMPGLVQLTIAGDVVMIAGEPETGIVTGNEVLDGEPTVGTGGRAVNDDQINFTHNISH